MVRVEQDQEVGIDRVEMLADYAEELRQLAARLRAH